MRLVFFGTPSLAVPTLDALVEAGHDVALVVTQTDKRRGRGGATLPSPVKQAAEHHGIPVSHRVQDALDVRADAGVLVAFGRLIKPDVLDAFTIINLHPSLLPRWRGATPVEASIRAGDDHTGICLMQLTTEMDAGPVYAKAETDILPNEKADALYDRLFEMGNALLIEMLAEAHLPDAKPQVGEPTYCGKLSPEDLHIDWTLPAEVISLVTRIGRAWTTLRGKRFLVLDALPLEKDGDGEPGVINGTRVATGKGSLELIRVQPEGKGPQEATAWARGARLGSNEAFDA